MTRDIYGSKTLTI